MLFLHGACAMGNGRSEISALYRTGRPNTRCAALPSCEFDEIDFLVSTANNVSSADAFGTFACRNCRRARRRARVATPRSAPLPCESNDSGMRGSCHSSRCGSVVSGTSPHGDAQRDRDHRGDYCRSGLDSTGRDQKVRNHEQAQSNCVVCRRDVCGSARIAHSARLARPRSVETAGHSGTVATQRSLVHLRVGRLSTGRAAPHLHRPGDGPQPECSCMGTGDTGPRRGCALVAPAKVTAHDGGRGGHRMSAMSSAKTMCADVRRPKGPRARSIFVMLAAPGIQLPTSQEGQALRLVSKISPRPRSIRESS